MTGIHSGGRIPPASLKPQTIWRDCPPLAGHHSGGRIPPASLKRQAEGLKRLRALPLRGENPPGLIEARPPWPSLPLLACTPGGESPRPH